MIILYVGRFIDRYPICSSYPLLNKRYSGPFLPVALALATGILA